MKTITGEALAGVLAAVPGTPRVAASGNYATPFTVLGVVDKALPEFNLFMLNAQRGIPSREGIRHETPFIGAGMRDNPRLAYYPCRLSRVPQLLKERLAPDVVVLHTSTPVDGCVSLGIETNIMPAAIEACKAKGGIVIAQANPNMPVTYGDAMIPLELIDYLVEVDEPIAEHGFSALDDVSTSIGDRIAHLIPDGASLQLGIGAVPDAVLRALLHRTGFRVWSEMFSDGVLALEKAGCMDQETQITASFSFGSKELYDWMDRNRRVLMLRTETTNAPGNIAKKDRVFSVNGALQVDLFGQANGTRAGQRLYSGFGGQADFVVGALHSPGGCSIIALRSVHGKTGNSAVVPVLPTAATSFQHSYLVTEVGVAEIWGNDNVTQAQNILDNICAPQHRDALREGGKALGLPLR